jgi:uncharacterized protein YyaL (SSP411 family)
VRATAPGAVLAVGPGEPAAGASQEALVTLLRDRPMVDGRPTAYVCRGFVCDRPTTDPTELAALLTP